MGLKLQISQWNCKVSTDIRLFQKISTHSYRRHWIWYQKTSGFQRKKIAVFVAFKPFIDSKSWGIQEFRKTFNGFSRIPDQNSQNSWEKFMDFQSVLQSLHYMISNVVQVGGWRGRIFSGIHVAHHHSSFEGNLMNFYSQSKISELW